MAIPTYEQFIEPILRFLAKQSAPVLARVAQEAAADALELSREARQEMVPSGVQATYKNRAGWAHDRLKRAGFSTSPRRGYWQLTAEGKTFASKLKGPMSASTLADLAKGHNDVRLRPSGLDSADDDALVDATHSLASPDDRLEDALAELRSGVARDLRDALANVSPAFFELVVLDLLHKMGYGATRADLQRVGGSGDAGIDGVIPLDKLGLEKVYVQAKRWQQSVGRPEVQAFYGALAGQRANKGVFITSSSFTAQAVEFARSVERVVLIDGARLANLMIDHEVGVTLRPVRVPKLDSDYFEGEFE